jgi:hypothetical protein
MTDSPDDRSATNPRVLMLRLVFEFLLQQNYFGAAAMMVAEHLGQIHRIEAAESSGNLSAQSLGTASVIWQQEVTGFKYWYGCPDDGTIAIMLRELTNKGMQQFVADLAVELQLSHPLEFEQQ